MNRRPLMWTGMDSVDVDWSDEAAADDAPARADRDEVRELVTAHEAAELEERRRKIRRAKSTPPGPSLRTSREIADRFGESALAWLEDEWKAGRIVRRNGRWPIKSATLKALLALRDGSHTFVRGDG